MQTNGDSCPDPPTNRVPAIAGMGPSCLHGADTSPRCVVAIVEHRNVGYKKRKCSDSGLRKSCAADSKKWPDRAN